MKVDDDIVIHPKRLKWENLIPETGLLLVNPTEARYGHERAESLGAKSQKLYNSRLSVNVAKGYFVAGPAIGASFAVMTAEKLIALGAKKILLFGWCGSMTDSLHIGDLVVPISALSGEGTSAYYPIGSQPSSSSVLVKSLRDKLREKSLPWSEGCVWSTDAPYREKREHLKKLAEEDGVCGVDMEYSALCSVACFRKIEFAALLVVSDEVWGKSWNPGFSRQDFKERSRMLIDLLLQEIPLDLIDHDPYI
jgi:purine-nucleoside phosphorylase